MIFLSAWIIINSFPALNTQYKTVLLLVNNEIFFLDV